MSSGRPEVADVLREFADVYRLSHPIGTQERRVLSDLLACRTAELGGHKLECNRCGHQEISYNSCRNRHCPKCQAAARADWLEKRRQDLLPVPYFHVVFTLPEELGPLALQNKEELYGLLFRVASDSLRTIAADEQHLGARIGFSAVLHTWGQTLRHHPHVHCVVAGGGVSADGSEWRACRPNFFLPVRVLSRYFRRKFLKGLQALYAKDELQCFGKLERLKDADAWQRLMSELRRKEWVVYCKPPFGGPEQVLKYLARYTHRVAISNERLVSVAEDQVVFRWKDYARGSVQRTMKLSGPEFIRRFLLHVLPKGFVRIRHYGFLANRVRAEELEQIRTLLAASTASSTSRPAAKDGVDDPAEARNCPECGEGTLLIVGELLPARRCRRQAGARSPPWTPGAQAPRIRSHGGSTARNQHAGPTPLGRRLP